MNMKKGYSLWGFILCLTLASCYNEDALTPTEGGIELRFKMPQGNNSWDDDIAKIHEDFGVYLIYDDLEDEDFNRAWTSGSSANLKGKGTLNDEMTVSYVRFMKNHIFPYLSNKKVINKILPMYWYLSYNVVAYSKMDLGFMVMEFNVPQNSLFNGLDFWSLCIYGKTDPMTGESFFFPRTQKEYSQRRNMILGEIFTRAIEGGNIKIPAEFETGFDHLTPLINSIGKEEDPDYYLNRGYPGRAKMSRFSEIIIPEAGLPPTNQKTFIGYLTILMFYNQEEILEAYPPSTYPLIAEKLKFVYKYVKDQYEIDLNEVANGPDEWETCTFIPAEE